MNLMSETVAYPAERDAASFAQNAQMLFLALSVINAQCRICTW